MKKYIILFLFIPGLLSGQSRQIVESVSGEDVSKRVSHRMQYVFPEFTNGEVFYIGMPKVSGSLNYNMLVGEMQFVENGQVLALADIERVLLVSIDNRKFYRFKKNEFAEELYSTGSCFLRARYRGNAVTHGKKGAYGTTSSTASITSYSSYSANNQTFNLNVAEEVLVSVDNFYYLVGTNGKYTQIKNVKAFTKHFPKYKSQIEAFVKENNIKFNDQNSLISLLAFCSTLEN